MKKEEVATQNFEGHQPEYFSTKKSNHLNKPL